MSSKNIYFDTNAIDFIWDKFTTYKKEGDSTLDINKTPFKYVLTSVYSVDELLITLSESNAALNSQKRGIAFLSIINKIPIIIGIAEILKMDVNIANVDLRKFPIQRSTIDRLIFNLANSLATGVTTGPLQNMIEDKSNARLIAKKQVQQIPANERIDFETFLDGQLIKYPNNNLHDFMNICMNIYVAFRDRKVKRPIGLNQNSFYKNPSHALNQQIDCYHVCYAKYVDVFVTNDKVLIWLIEKLKAKDLLSCRVITPKDFFSLWLKAEILGNELI